MNAQDLWELFQDTGAPELYLMYSNARRMENIDVLDDSGARSAGSEL